MGHFKNLIKDSLAYGVASILSRFIGFLLMPLYTSILSPADYGVLNIVNTTLMLLTLFSVLGLDSAAHIFFFDSDEVIKRKEVFSTWFWVQFGFSLLLAISLLLLSNRLSILLFESPENSKYFKLSGFVLLSGVLPSLAINWFRVRRLPWPTTWFSLTLGLVTIGLNILFIAYYKLGIEGFLFAQLISGVAMSVATLVIMRKWLSIFLFSKHLINRMLRYSLPLIPAALAYWCLNFAGTYFLQILKGEGEVGLYQTGSTIASIMMVLIGAFTQAWGPFAMSIKSQVDVNSFYAKVLIVYVTIVGGVAAFIGIFSNEFLFFLTSPSYWEADKVTAILAFNSMISGMNFIAALGMNFSKNMKPFSLAVIAGAIVNLGLFYFSINLLSKEGCALSILLTNIGVTYFIFRASQRMYFIPYDFKRAVAILFSCILFVVLSKMITLESLLTLILLKFALLLLLFGSIGYLNKDILIGFVTRFVKRNG